MAALFLAVGSHHVHAPVEVHFVIVGGPAVYYLLVDWCSGQPRRLGSLDGVVGPLAVDVVYPTLALLDDSQMVTVLPT